MIEKDQDEIALSREFWDRLCAYRTALRSASKSGTPRPELDIDTAAYMVAIDNGDRYSFGDIIDKIIANQGALRPEVRNFLIKRLRARAEARRRQAQLNLAAADHWDAVANQLKEPKNVTDEPSPSLVPAVDEPADTEFLE